MTLKNVPAEEQFFCNTGESHSKVRPLLDSVHKYKKVEQNNMHMYSVAVHNHGQGKIVYSGDVNAEPVTCDLVAAYCFA